MRQALALSLCVAAACVGDAGGRAPCASDGDCPAGNHCATVVSVRACVQTALGVVGDACRADRDCAGGLSCRADWPGGTCTAPCPGGVPCGAGAMCATLGGEAACVPRCAGDGECRAGYVCAATEGGNGCVPISEVMP